MKNSDIAAIRLAQLIIGQVTNKNKETRMDFSMQSALIRRTQHIRGWNRLGVHMGGILGGLQELINAWKHFHFLCLQK